ncbi:MAG: tetratricopeptide repeat protein, partial [Acidobacteriota bacterium]
MTRCVERLRAGGVGMMAWTLCVSGAASAEPSTEPLPPLDISVERRLVDDAAHRYTLPVDRGDLWIVVDQHGIDVELVTTTAAGDEAPLDQPGERWGTDWLRLPADDPTKALTIRPATPGSGPGRYRLLVEARGETRGETQGRTGVGARDEASELRRGIAERAVTAAGRLYPAWNREAWAEAAEHYARAIDHWRAVGADAEAARATFLHALLLRQLDELDAASAGLRRALDLWNRLDDRRGQALASMELANTARFRGEQAEAETLCRQALALWRALDDAYGQAATYNYLGLIRAREDPRAAVEPYRQALERYQQVGDTVQEGVLLNNLGGTHHLLGEPHEALGYFHRAAEIHARRGDLLHQAIAWTNIASVHRRTGRLHDAIDGYHRSLDARRASEDVRGEARVLNNLGSTWLRLGDAERAHDVLRQALVRRRESGDRRGEAITLHNLGTVHEATNDWHAVLDVELQALAIRRALGDRVGEATSLRAIGRATGRLGRLDEARGHFADAAAILDEAGATWLRASVAWHLGEMLTNADAIGEAIEALRRALTLYRQTGDVLGEGETLVALARAERAASRSGTAFDHIDKALDLLESVRANVDHLGLRSSFFSDQAPAFELAIELAMDRHRQDPKAGWDRRAFAFSERSRARSLLDWLDESRNPADLDPSLLDRQRR